MRLRDTQRSKLYDWEDREFNTLGTKLVTDSPQMELSEIRKLLTKVARDYGLTRWKPDVTDGRGRRKACYSPSWNEIKLPRWSRRRYIVLHEIAHWIEYVAFPGRCAWHGREFVGIFMELLRRYHGADLAQMTASANAARLDFEPNSRCTAKYLKKHGLKA